MSLRLSRLVPSISAMSLVCLHFSSLAQAQTATGTPASSGAQDLGNVQDVVVTTAVRGEQRILAESPAPVDIISAQQLQLTGRSPLGEAIAKLLPAFNFGTNLGGINSIVRPVTNHGLGPAYTLVLVNGKRRHASSLLTNGGGDTSGVNAVDLDMIPLSAVDHIEVLRDSAAAQYGSDAVAGVINVVLKSGDHGGHLAALGGNLYGGHGDLGTTTGEADAGFALANNGFVHLSTDIRKRGLAWWLLPATNRVIFSPASDPRNASWNGDGAHNGDPEITALNFSYNAELPLDNGITLYSFATLGFRTTEIGNNFRRPNSNADIPQIFPAGYYPLNNTREYDYQIVAGGKGQWLGWNWDASTSYGKNRNHQYSNLSINPSLGPASPTSFSNLATYQLEQLVNNIDITRSFDVGFLKKPVQVAFGTEYKLDRFSTFAGDPAGYINGGYIFKSGDQSGDPNVGLPTAVGTQAGVTLSPADTIVLTRTSIAGYGDVGFYPTDPWFVDASVRGEHYSDSSGSTVSWKLNSRYDITPEIAVRGSIGTGFRAPSLSQIGYAQTDNRTNRDLSGNIVPSLSKLARNNSPLARALGAENLTPEKTENFGAGLVLAPLPNLNFTADGYGIYIKDRIIRTGFLYGPAVRPILIGNGLSGTEWVDYFANGADTFTKGVDLVADSTQDYGDFGKVRWSAGFNYNNTDITHVKSAPGVLSSLGPNPGGNLIWFPRTSRADLTNALPTTKLILSARWLIRDFDINLRLTRYGSYFYTISENAAQDTWLSPTWITDIDITYTFTPGLSVSVGASNLFNVRPGYVTPDPNTGGGYAPSPFAPSGGFYYAKIAYDF